MVVVVVMTVGMSTWGWGGSGLWRRQRRIELDRQFSAPLCNSLRHLF
jgi:hypothetical protein